jgi:hypothetical protein
MKPRADELALLDRRDAPRAPKRVWSAELFAFLAQSGTLSAMVILSLIGVLAGAAVRVARMFNPVAGAERSAVECAKSREPRTQVARLLHNATG